MLLSRGRMKKEWCDRTRGALETSARTEHSWMLTIFHRSVLSSNCTFRYPPFPVRRAKCTFNAQARPFDWRGQNKESITVALRSGVARPFGTTSTETIWTRTMKKKTRRCAGKNWKTQRLPISRYCHVGEVPAATECS